MTEKTGDAVIAEIAASSPEKAAGMKHFHDAVENAKQKKKGIAICGSHPQTWMYAPFDNPDWLIYACSPHNIEHRTLPRVDQWFEVHQPITDKTRGYHYLRTLEAMNYPVVWMRDRDAMRHFPTSKEYPEDELKAKFNPYLFTSSIAFMLAKAIDDCEREGINQIGLFGILQASETEYNYQRPGTQYFIGEAVKRRIHVHAADVSKLLDVPPEIF